MRSPGPRASVVIRGRERRNLVRGLPSPARMADAGPERGELGSGARGRGHPSAQRLCWGIFLVSLAAFLLTAGVRLLGQDQEYYYRMARAIALVRSFAVEPLVVGGTEVSGARGPDGRFYAQYAPGLPLALAPVLLAEPLQGFPLLLVCVALLGATPARASAGSLVSVRRTVVRCQLHGPRVSPCAKWAFTAFSLTVIVLPS